MSSAFLDGFRKSGRRSKPCFFIAIFVALPSVCRCFGGTSQKRRPQPQQPSQALGEKTATDPLRNRHARDKPDAILQPDIARLIFSQGTPTEACDFAPSNPKSLCDVLSSPTH